MPRIIAGVEIPDTPTAAAATRFIEETTDPLLFHHSRRVFLFGSLHARALGLHADPELLYVAALFHDLGLVKPFSDAEQRFEIDGADHAQAFLRERGFSSEAADVVWNAIALHTTPGIPGRMGPEIHATNLGVLTDAIGFGTEDLDAATVGDIVAAHPRGDFKSAFVRTFYDGLKHRPDTTYGTINADVLEHFAPEFRRTSMVDRILASSWTS